MKADGPNGFFSSSLPLPQRKIDWLHFFFPLRDLGENSPLMGPLKWKSFFVSLLEAIQAQ